MFTNIIVDNKKKGRFTPSTHLVAVVLTILMYFCWSNNQIMYGVSCAIIGNIFCNKCLRLPSFSTFIVASICIVGCFDSITLDWKMFATNVLLGCAFARFVVMTLGVLWTGYKQVENYKTKQVLLIHQLVLIYWRVVLQTISFYNPEPY
jgi:hypothetical protein